MINEAGCVTGFAGSQYSDERRRRRLAVEQDGTLKKKSRTAKREAGLELDSITLVDLAIQAIVPRSIWPHIGATLFLAVLLLGGHAALDALPQNNIVDISQLRHVVDDAHRVTNGLCLFVTMQICMVIRQVRGRSRNDFDGRYRLWNWVTVTSGMFSAALFLNLHTVMGGIVAALLNRPDLTTSPITWQVPVLTIGGLLLLELGREMRENRPTCALLYLSALCYLVPLLFSLKLFSGFLAMLPPSIAGMPIEAIAFMTGNILLFTTMSLHARFVVHFNPEPPTSTVRQFRLPLPRLRRPRLRIPRLLRLPKLPRLKLPTFKKLTFKFPAFKLKLPSFKLKFPKRKPRAVSPVLPVVTETVRPAPTKSASAPKKRKSPPRQTRTEPAHIEPPAPQPAIVAAAVEQAPRRSAPRKPLQKPKTRASKRPIEEQIDEVTADELKGLSKKQKRELRKKRRETQRSAH
jgi:hypothetical protein